MGQDNTISHVVRGQAIRLRINLLTVTVAVAAIAALVSPWSNSIPPAHLAQSFGFQTPAAWLAAFGLMGAVLLDSRLTVFAVGVVTAVLLSWFAWAMWVVTTSAFTSLPFQFMGTDVIGPGWYAAAIGLLIAATALVKALVDHHARVGAELWVLTVIPGYGLMRLGRWAAGFIFAALVTGGVYFASTDSPDPALWAEYGRYGNAVPPAYPRGPEWVLLGLAAGTWVLSVAATVVARRRGPSR